MKIAIASSGLGHVSRGIETWALDTAEALASRGIDVTLFAAAALPLRRTRAACSPAVASAKSGRVSVLRCWRRSGRTAQWLASVSPGFLWRWGLKSAYGWEQLSFWWHLWPRLRRGRYDVLHVQDPMVAEWCRRFRRLGSVRTKEILAHGTEETPEFLGRFDYVQHLAPWHLANADPPSLKLPPTPRLWRTRRRTGCGMRNAECGTKVRHWVAIPNFVDTEVFRPAAGDDEKRTCRARFGIPADAFVVGTMAAVKKHHKRIDYLIREFAGLATGRDVSRIPDLVPRIFLVVAGARQDETDELITLAQSLCGDSIEILLDVQRADMPGLYRCLDLFVLTSLFEMMPIAVLEALASGVPVVANDHPVLRWMIGAERDDVFERGPTNTEHREPNTSPPGGWVMDMAAQGELARFLSTLDSRALPVRAAGARRRAMAMFSGNVVIAQYIDYYGRILQRKDPVNNEHG